MENPRNKIVLMVFIALSFFVAGCENSGVVTKMQKDIAALSQEIEKKNAEITTLNGQLAYQVELTQKQGEDLKYILKETDEDLKALRAEMASIKNGELASFKIDMTGMRKEIDAIHARPRKLDSGSRADPDTVLQGADTPPGSSGAAEEAVSD